MIKNMNSKIITNSQLSATELKKQTNKANNQNRKGITEMEITWRVISGERWWEMGGKVQGTRSINGRYKIDRGRLRIVQEMENQRTYMYDPWT